MFNRVVRAALDAAAIGRHLEDEDRIVIVPSHKRLKARLTRWHKEARTESGLLQRISRPKRRRSWLLEHVVRLLRSPIHARSSSPAQPWRKAAASKRLVIRDAVYWVPLFMFLQGVRPEEILQLKLRNARMRDGLVCLFLGENLDDSIKTAQSRRILPVPDLLLRLGFRD